MRSKCWQISK